MGIEKILAIKDTVTMKDLSEQRLVRSTFRFFPDLPKELRLQIWSYNLPGPRYVEIIEKDGAFGCTPIANLSVCKESRYEALRVYTLAFSVGGAPAVIPFNFETDVLLFGWKLSRKAYFRDNCSDIAKVRRIALMAFGRLSQSWAGESTETGNLVFECLEEFTWIKFTADEQNKVKDRGNVFPGGRIIHYGRHCPGKDECRCFQEERDMAKEIVEKGPLLPNLAVHIVHKVSQEECEALRYSWRWSMSHETAQSWKFPRMQIAIASPNWKPRMLNRTKIAKFAMYYAKHVLFSVEKRKSD